MNNIWKWVKTNLTLHTNARLEDNHMFYVFKFHLFIYLKGSDIMVLDSGDPLGPLRKQRLSQEAVAPRSSMRKNNKSKASSKWYKSKLCKQITSWLGKVVKIRQAGASKGAKDTYYRAPDGYLARQQFISYIFLFDTKIIKHKLFALLTYTNVEVDTRDEKARKDNGQLRRRDQRTCSAK